MSERLTTVYVPTSSLLPLHHDRLLLYCVPHNLSRETTACFAMKGSGGSTFLKKQYTGERKPTHIFGAAFFTVLNYADILR